MRGHWLAQLVSTVEHMPLPFLVVTVMLDSSATAVQLCLTPFHAWQDIIVCRVHFLKNFVPEDHLQVGFETINIRRIINVYLCNWIFILHL